MSGVLFKWHAHNLHQSLQQMFQSETMVDVTLAVEGQLLKAHRVVLCLMSTSSAEPQLYLRVDEMSQCDENDFVTLVIGSQVNEKSGEAIGGENASTQGSEGVLPETLCLDSLDCAVEEKCVPPVASECFLLATGSPASRLADTVIVSTCPEPAVVISTAQQEQHSARPPGRQYTRDDMKQALEQIRAGKMGIKPAARAYNIPVATLHNAARRCNIASPMQQGANHGNAHARQLKRPTTATATTATTAGPVRRGSCSATLEGD
ncbi:uncharacterized protein LOC134534060 isoform X2 [Bacillus rossius redtenbacheri]|uniref:uncharacterized protein LOC134534060 isoform X2 n=1 Tax=Bacillus rossius redtenbacheri TaxID=93214 RepID=UPI002FDEAB49